VSTICQANIMQVSVSDTCRTWTHTEVPHASVTLYTIFPKLHVANWLYKVQIYQLSQWEFHDEHKKRGHCIEDHNYRLEFLLHDTVINMF